MYPVHLLVFLGTVQGVQIRTPEHTYIIWRVTQ
nr:MAG TPA_asm: hypothetical protein [Caudoviricetes sp.]